MTFINLLRKIKIFFGLKGNLKSWLYCQVLILFFCCNSASYHYIALDSPNKMIALEDSLIHVGLTEKTREALALAHKNIGLTYMSEKDYVKAKAHFLKTLTYSLDDSTAEYNLLMIEGHLLRRTGKKEKLWDAIETYYKALKLKPYNGEPYFFIGKSYFGLSSNNFELILESYQNALGLELSKSLRKEAEQEIFLVSEREKKLKDFWK